MSHAAVDLSFHSLPQYGSIALPFMGSRAPVIGEKIASRLSSASDLDAFLGTPPERTMNSAAVLGPRLSREALAGHNRRAWEAWTRPENGGDQSQDFIPVAPFRFRSHVLVIGDAAESSETWSPGSYAALSSISFVRPNLSGFPARCRLDVDLEANAKRAKFSFTENGLETEMEAGGDFVRTTGYAIRTDEKGLRDFIVASFKYYSGVDGALLTGLSDLVLAADLVFHQQFVREEGGASPYEWQPYAREQALGADFESAFREGFMERVFVPGNDGSEPVVEIRRLMDLSIEISIRRPADHAGLMPLKGNVLVLGARSMAPGKFPEFVDLMAQTVRQ